MFQLKHNKGSWHPKRAVPAAYLDAHTKLEELDLGNGLHAYRRGVAAYHQTTKTHALLGVTCPGMHALYYALAKDGSIHWDEYAWPLARKLRGLGLGKPKIERVDAGQAVVWDGKRLTPVHVESYQLPILEPSTGDAETDLVEAADYLWEVFVRAADEMYTLAGKPKVLTMLSGGADATLTAIAMREIGADQECVTLGVNEDDFDPLWARRYAHTLGLPWKLLKVPTHDQTLAQLALETIGTIEANDFSNVLMAMCTTLARRYAHEQGRPVIFKGHFSDDMLGNHAATWGSFKKKFEGNVTDDTWRTYRAGLYASRSIPNDLQVAKVCRAGDQTTWRSVFTHRDVMDVVYSMPMTVVPLSNHKPLLWTLLNRWLPDGAWNSHHKVGYYSGAGISKIRLVNPVLQDASFRHLYQVAKERLS